MHDRAEGYLGEGGHIWKGYLQEGCGWRNTEERLRGSGCGAEQAKTRVPETVCAMWPLEDKK